MKRKIKISLLFIFMTMLFSCDYETHVINTVHEDGSVTRTVIVKNSEKKLTPPASGGNFCLSLGL